MSAHRFSPAAVLVATAATAGLLVGGVATADASPQAPANACSASHTATAKNGSWGPASNSGCSVFGYTGKKQGYGWKVLSGTYACAEGWGFDSAHPHGGWFALGCGALGGGSVPWGNVLAAPQLRVEGEGSSVIVSWNM